MKFSQLFFAANSILFTSVLEKNLNGLINILLGFGKASGQLINFAKSGILLSANVSHEDFEFVRAKLKV